MDGRTFKVTLVGETTYDLKARSLEALDHTVCGAGRLVTCPGGTARNVAENLARLSVSTGLVSATGNDPRGREVVYRTALAGVNMGQVIQSDRFPTALFMGFLDEDGRVLHGMVEGSVLELVTSDFVRRLEDTFKVSNLVVLDSSMPLETMLAVREICLRLRVPLVITPAAPPNASRVLPCLEGSLMVACNHHEARQLTGLDTSSHEGVRRAASQLLERGTTIALITMGPDGLIIKSPTEDLKLPAVARSVVDPMGAGDAFLAGFLYGFLNGLPLLKALEIGQFTSALTLDTDENVHPKLSLDYVHSSIV